MIFTFRVKYTFKTYTCTLYIMNREIDQICATNNILICAREMMMYTCAQMMEVM